MKRIHEALEGVDLEKRALYSLHLDKERGFCIAYNIIKFEYDISSRNIKFKKDGGTLRIRIESLGCSPMETGRQKRSIGFPLGQ